LSVPKILTLCIPEVLSRPSQSEFQPGDVETLRFLTPHVRRAFKLHFQFAEAKSKSTNLEAAVDLIPNGVVFLGRHGQIVSMNAAASAAFSCRDGILATRDGSIQAER
jgi:PAS domain-containing protein